MESVELQDVASTQGPNGAVASASAQSLDPEYKSPFAVRPLSPDHSPPELNDLYGPEFGPTLPDLELDAINPFGQSLPDFGEAMADPLLETSETPYIFPLSNYSKMFGKVSASSSNEAQSPASSFGPDNQIGPTWDPSDGMDDIPDDIPDLEDVDPTYDPRAHHTRLDDIDSDHLDDDPSLLIAASGSLPVTPPSPSQLSATPAREAAPSPPSTHDDSQGPS
jgi:hypothetical protein